MLIFKFYKHLKKFILDISFCVILSHLQDVFSSGFAFCSQTSVSCNLSIYIKMNCSSVFNINRHDRYWLMQRWSNSGSSSRSRPPRLSAIYRSALKCCAKYLIGAKDAGLFSVVSLANIDFKLPKSLALFWYAWTVSLSWERFYF